LPFTLLYNFVEIFREFFLIVLEFWRHYTFGRSQIIFILFSFSSQGQAGGVVDSGKLIVEVSQAKNKTLW
jgi:hypothetical protein